MFSLLNYSTANAQSTTKSFRQTPITNIISELEQETDLIFNYEPQLLKKYTFSGNLQNKNLSDLLKDLFYNTPFEYELGGNSVTVYKPELKEYTICGNVTDLSNKESLPLANIYLDNFRYGTQTDNDGNFELKLKAYKNQKLTVSYIGFESKELMIQELDKIGCTTFELDIDKQMLSDEIVVTDYVLQGIEEGKSYNAVSFDYNDLAKKNTALEQDILKTLQYLPGISSLDESATNLQIRGSASDQNLIVWEDVPLYDSGHYFGMISSVNPFVIDKVNVYKGVFSPKYDNRTGGIIDMSLSNSIPQKVNASIGSTLTEAHAVLSVPILKKVAITGAYRTSLNAIFNSPTIDQFTKKVFQNSKIYDENDLNDKEVETSQNNNFCDVNTKLLFKATPKLSFKTSFFTSANNFRYGIDAEEFELESVDDVYSSSLALNTSLQYKLNKNWNIDAAYILSSYEHTYLYDFYDFKRGDDIEHTRTVFNDIEDKYYKINLSYDSEKAFSANFGYDFNRKVANFSYEEEDVNFDDANYNTNVGHFHNINTSLDYDLSNFKLNLGLKGAYYNEANNFTLSPRLNLQYAFNKNLKVSASGGIFYQYISQLNSFGENDLDLDTPVWILSSSEFDKAYIQANKISAGLIYRKKAWLLNAEIYRNKTLGLNTISTSFNSALDLEISSGESNAYGLDLLLKKQFKYYETWVNYSLSKVDFNFSEISNQLFPSTNDQRHKLSFINTFRYKQFALTFNYQFRTGLPYSIPDRVDSEEVFIEDEGNVLHHYLVYEEINKRRLNNYARLDMGASYTPSFKRIKATFSFSLINLLNRENIFSKEYFLQNRNEPEPPRIRNVEKLLLGRTPQILIRLEY